jgi:DNA transposition AAA+ family ATPase
VEFCDACRRYRYIGLCYGASGVGKTLSARLYANWDHVQTFWNSPERSDALLKEVSKGTTTFFTAPVVVSPGQLAHDIWRCRSLLHDAAIKKVQRREETRTDRLARRAATYRDPRRNPEGFSVAEAQKIQRAVDLQRYRAGLASSKVSDPTTLLVVDEADRLKVAGLEQVRSVFDEGGLGLILIGMPGIEKRLARYPQLYSRIGFVHEFRPLAPTEVRGLLAQCWAPPGVRLPPQPWAEDVVAAIIRITGGNFRLLSRLLTQTERVLEINALDELTTAVVEAARESLVIGEA